MLARTAGDVEARLRTSARESDIPPLLQPCFASAENESAVDRKPLGGMSRKCVRVTNVAHLDVSAAQRGRRAAIGGDCDRALFEVDPLDGAGGAVLDTEDGVVAQADDAITDREVALGHTEPRLAEATVGVHERAGELVKVGNVAAPQSKHHVPGEIVASVRPPVCEQARSCGDGAVRDDEPLAFL